MKEQMPGIPRWAHQFLAWFCAADILEEVEGDLYETYVLQKQEMGEKYARKKYITNVLRFFNFSSMIGHKAPLYNKPKIIMTDINLRLILRRLLRQKLNTSLHIAGLTIGLSVCILIGLFIYHELSFDNYHSKAHRIYRVNQIWESDGEKELNFGAPAPLANALKENIPGIEHIGVAYTLEEDIIDIKGQEKFNQGHILMADAGLLDVFDFNVIRGDGQAALSQPNQALLTESTAKKFFGSDDPMGKTFEFKNLYHVTVAGIISDPPQNTHLPASMLLSYFPLEPWLIRNKENWGMTFGASTFVVLEDGIDPESLHAPIRALYDQNLNTNPEDPDIGYAELQALSDIHLNPDVGGGGDWVQAINPLWLWFFGCIGILVLILASINFVNLSLAQALTRAREVGIRKTIGAGRFQLVRQFLGETFLLIVVSSILAIAISIVSLPKINNLVDKNMAFDALSLPGAVMTFGLFLLIIGLFTGIYPALFISKFQPAESVKASITSGHHRSNLLRKGLVIFQFAISGSLLIALLIMSQQMRLFHHKNLGFDKENVVTVRIPNVSKNEAFKTILASNPGIDNVSFAMVAPASTSSWTTRMHETDLNAPDRKNVRIIWADEEYDNLYDLKLLAGRFTENRDTNAVSSSIPESAQSPRVVVNEKFIEEMEFGSPQEAIGREFIFGFNNWKAEIVGVMADFNISSLHQAIQPLMISPLDRFYWNASIKLKAGQESNSLLSNIESNWNQLFPDQIFDFTFVDDTIQQYYESESMLYSLFKIFAGMAMLISCLGLWGLATFSAVQRTREIGIRKVLGASINGLIALLSKDFLSLVFIALIIATPVSWYGMNSWLKNFAFRIDIHWPVFAISFLVVILIAILTMSFQSIKTALANPVRALRNE